MTSNEPFSEQWRIAAEEWVDADAAARALEETKTAVFAQKVLGQGDIPVNRAEANVRGSREWHDYLKKIVDAKTHANKLRVRVDYLKMRYFEEQGAEASKRAEMRL